MILEGNAVIHDDHFLHTLNSETPFFELSAGLSTDVDNLVCNYCSNFHSPSTI
jgi:hypothetical protein